ncbi:MAG: hypothetical protein PUP92_21850 [Rhizonema sp. PD38]|nr:hypothetical protein [Rhizonema sp. PD38]
MSFVNAACCAVSLQQQQEQNIRHHQQFAHTSVDCGKSSSKNCTVVENGRVVVKPVETLPQEDA